MRMKRIRSSFFLSSAKSQKIQLRRNKERRTNPLHTQQPDTEEPHTYYAHSNRRSGTRGNESYQSFLLNRSNQKKTRLTFYSSSEK